MSKRPRLRTSRHAVGRVRRPRQVIDSLADPVLTLDRSGRISHVNDAACALLRCRRADLQRRLLWEAFPEMAGTLWESAVRRAIAERTVAEFHAPSVAGTSRLAVRAVPWRHGVGLFLREPSPDGHARAEWDRLFAAERAAREVAEAAQAELSYRALHDSLTGLPNRALLLDRLRLAASRRHGTVALLFMDLDDFKGINDSFGHAVGDEVILEIARRLAGVVRPSDTLARLGGDEFVLCLPDVSAEAAVRVGHRVLAASRQPMSTAGRELVVTTSVGIAVSGDGPFDPHELLRDADAALYVAKARSRDCLVVFDDEVRRRAGERLEIESLLHAAIETDALQLHYQPCYDARTGRLTSLEALLRWVHPTRGLLLPAEFLDVAEESGLILSLGDWVLERAAAQASTWRAALADAAPVLWVNLAARQLGPADFPERVADLHRRHELPHGALGLEISEPELHDSRVGRALADVGALGVPIGIDKFGTGGSSLGRLQRLHMTAVKIDRSFITRVPDQKDDVAVVQAAIGLAHTFGAVAVAEGVPGRSVVDWLLRAGCDQLCGFGLAVPDRPEKIDLTAQRIAL